MNAHIGGWSAWADRQLDDIRAAGQWRATRRFDALGPAGELFVGGNALPVISFASNDYLGLSAHPAVIAAAHEAIDRWGTGSTASRLIVGTRACHHELEDEIADWKGCPRAVVYPTGYAANLGVLSVVGGPDVTILSDELNHASLIDGCRLSRSKVHVYAHGDLDHVASLLAASAGPTVVVTDSVFSMDGDVAAVDELGRVCADHGALLVLDEAHSALGPHISGDIAGATGGLDLIRVGTLSKTLGALGGWVAGSQPLIDLLINRSRPYIFTTAPSPADIAAALAALRVLRSEEGDRLLARLRTSIDRLAPLHPSPIIPIVLGDEARAMHASAALLEQGILVPAIRPPTVPVGSSRLRIALSAIHTDEMLDRLVDELDALGLR
ncbi:MAG: 8-amino-7-oxononanoate synthase [Ilumatobacteraceae bacterium]|nr:8-amino-7-oxononanoate synthase [Ilumatobacteraceae bacterium]